MAKTAWRERPASSKQLYWIAKLADEKQVGDLDEVLLDTIADVASEQPVTSGQASDLLDILFKAPRKPKPSAGFAPLVSDRPERVARLAKAKAEAEQAVNEAQSARDLAGGTAWNDYCIKCAHQHEVGSTCGASIEVRMSDYSDYYACTCTETGRGTEATQAAGALNAKAARLEFGLYEYEREAAAFRRGDHVVVARGRKVPKGSTGQILKVSDGAYGQRAFLLLADGSKAWTALSNCDHEEV